ncbi:MAG: hypothetical protein PVI57_15950 [Gemmatimonadota bacterium]|jgi:ammonia channel protein AmtB
MILAVHSGLRYLILLLGLAVLAYAVYGLVAKRDFDETMRKLGGFFAISMHLNLLVGVGVLFTGQFYPQLAGHIFMMVFAAAAAQIVPSVMKKRPMEERTYAPYVVSTVIAIGLVWGGLAAIQHGIV